MKGFIEFVREQGVVGFAVGFILGGAVSTVVASFVNDIVSPLISGLTKHSAGLYVSVYGAKIMYGSFIGTIINFLILALVVYLSVKLLRLDKLDVEKEKK